MVNKNYNEFSSSFTQAVNLEGELGKIGSQLELLSAKIEDPENGIRARMVNPKKEMTLLEKQLDHTTKVVEILNILAQATLPSPLSLLGGPPDLGSCFLLDSLVASAI